MICKMYPKRKSGRNLGAWKKKSLKRRDRGDVLRVVRDINRIPYLIVFLVLITGGCATLKPAPPTPDTHSIPPALGGELSRVTSEFEKDHSRGQSGFLLLSNSAEAYKWRLALVDQATQSIDTQYFIWQNDETGILLFERLLRAADRGVRVRLLVDDMVFAPEDSTIAGLTMHPNIDIKIYNPGNVRNSTLGALGDFIVNFKELNRRMHNKLFIADNHVAIVGGRNIGNEYFGLSKKYNFRDLDVLVVGSVVPELANAFDAYWNAELSYPGRAMSDEGNIEEIETIRKRAETYLAENREILSSYPLKPKDWVKEIRQLQDSLLPGKAQFIQDNPVQMGENDYRLFDMLDHISTPGQKELIIVSPYFIPTEKIAAFQEGVGKAGADWQMIYFGGAVHSFTNPAADKKNIKGLAYNPNADKRSWKHMQLFFEEIF